MIAGDPVGTSSDESLGCVSCAFQYNPSVRFLQAPKSTPRRYARLGELTPAPVDHDEPTGVEGRRVRPAGTLRICQEGRATAVRSHQRPITADQVTGEDLELGRVPDGDTLWIRNARLRRARSRREPRFRPTSRFRRCRTRDDDLGKGAVHRTPRGNKSSPARR